MTAEEHQLRRFAEIIGLEGQLVSSDSPDLLVHREGTTLGVEHTRLLQPQRPGHSLRAFESEMAQAIRQAQLAYDATKPGDLHVWVLPNTRAQIASRDRDSIATDLESVVRMIRPEAETRGHVRAEEWRFRQLGLPFPKAVQSVTVAVTPGIKQSAWAPTSSGVVPRLEPTAVAQRVASKNARVPTYREQCDEIWLVIALEGFSASGFWDLEDFPFEHPFETLFDRLFLHDVFSASVYELRKAT